MRAFWSIAVEGMHSDEFWSDIIANLLVFSGNFNLSIEKRSTLRKADFDHQRDSLRYLARFMYHLQLN
jgi:hypothetical protein